MRALVRRVSNAEVKVSDQTSGSIQHGLVVFLGVDRDDHLSDADWILKKVLEMRIFEDETGKMNQSIRQDHGILLISQFTLFGNLQKGTRPSFNRASDPQKGNQLYSYVLQELMHSFAGVVQSGVFGADMKIRATDCGPVTIWLDSKNRKY